MNCLDQTEARELDTRDRCLISMPFGLLGFEQFKRFALLTNPAEEPFLWLQVPEDPKLAFLVISPFAVLQDYRPEIPEEDAQFLDLRRPEEALIFNIVTLRGPGAATLNLKGPIVLNRRTLTAKQVIPVNAPELSVAHPLPLHGG